MHEQRRGKQRKGNTELNTGFRRAPDGLITRPRDEVRTELLVHHAELEVGEAVARVEVDGALEGGEGQLVLPLRRKRPAQVLTMQTKRKRKWLLDWIRNDNCMCLLATLWS